MNLEEFKPTPIIKKMKKSKSEEKLNEIAEKVDSVEKVEEPIVKVHRGRKTKYTTDEERINARKLQQREYRERKKQELKELKDKLAEYEALVKQ